MRFASDYYGWGFLAVAALCLFFIWAGRRKQKAIDQFIGRELFGHLGGMVNKRLQKTKSLLLVCVFGLSVVALMRPQWGFSWQEIERQGLDIVVALDISKSMLAGDVKPNRLARSKLAIRDLVKKLSGDRIGLIAFSGAAYLQCPLTIDYEGFLFTLENVDTDSISRGGTSLASAIETAMKVFEGGNSKHSALIIITDGEDHEGNIEALSKRARDLGIKIFTVGIGTKEGELIQIDGAFVKDKQGNVVKSRLNEDILREIAFITSGMYVHSTSSEFGLETIYRERLSKMEKQDIKAAMEKRYHERFQIFIALAIILAAAEQFISDKKRV
jgi:Ca-activated chloride channel homolog